MGFETASICGGEVKALADSERDITKALRDIPMERAYIERQQIRLSLLGLETEIFTCPNGRLILRYTVSSYQVTLHRENPREAYRSRGPGYRKKRPPSLAIIPLDYDRYELRGAPSLWR